MANRDKSEGQRRLSKDCREPLYRVQDLLIPEKGETDGTAITGVARKGIVGATFECHVKTGRPAQFDSSLAAPML